MLGRTAPKNLQPIYLSSYKWTTYTTRMKGLSLLKKTPGTFVLSCCEMSSVKVKQGK